MDSAFLAAEFYRRRPVIQCEVCIFVLDAWTLHDPSGPLGTPPGLGVRQSSGALAPDAGTTNGKARPRPSRGPPKSGRGLPQSKTLRDSQGRWELRQVLECASPLALWHRTLERQTAKRGRDRREVLRKAVEGYRSPRRFATPRAAGNSARSWSAPVLWRFGTGRWNDKRQSAAAT